MRAGVCDHLRLIARPLLSHSLLGVLVEQLVWIEFRAVAWHETKFQHGLPLPLRLDPAGHLGRLMGGMRVDNQDDLPAISGFQEPGKKADEDIGIEAA